MAPIAIDVGIGNTLQAINTILARRESERGTMWDTLADQLEAVSLTVGELDHMHFALLAEMEKVFAEPKPSRARIDAVIEQAGTFCTDGRLTIRVAEWRGVVQAAAFNHALKHRRYRILTSTLRSIDDPLRRYIERLGFLQEGGASDVRELTQQVQTGDTSGTRVRDQQWNLRTVLELLKLMAVQLEEDDTFREGLVDPEEACEEAFRNYDRALALTLGHLIGLARQDLAMESL
jgi:hypothetical protein